jgi:hypothetical protein
MKRFAVSTAKGCAWRGLYVHIRSAQVFRIVLDPTAPRGPTLHLWLGLSNFANVQPAWLGRVLWHAYLPPLRIPLPHVRWHYRGSRVRNWLAGKSARFWHALDGRRS